jgi:hypothetical protein
MPLAWKDRGQILLRHAKGGGISTMMYFETGPSDEMTNAFGIAAAELAGPFRAPHDRWT